MWFLWKRFWSFKGSETSPRHNIMSKGISSETTLRLHMWKKIRSKGPSPTSYQHHDWEIGRWETPCGSGLPKQLKWCQPKGWCSGFWTRDISQAAISQILWLIFSVRKVHRTSYGAQWPGFSEPIFFASLWVSSWKEELDLQIGRRLACYIYWSDHGNDLAAPLGMMRAEEDQLVDVGNFAKAVKAKQGATANKSKKDRTWI